MARNGIFTVGLYDQARVLLMMYYTTVSGWMLSYFVKFITGSFKSGMDADAVGGAFSNLLANPVEMAVFMAITVVATDLLFAVLVCRMVLREFPRS